MFLFLSLNSLCSRPQKERQHNHIMRQNKNIRYTFCRDAIHRVHPREGTPQAGGRDESRPYRTNAYSITIINSLWPRNNAAALGVVPFFLYKVGIVVPGDIGAVAGRCAKGEVALVSNFLTG